MPTTNKMQLRFQQSMMQAHAITVTGHEKAVFSGPLHVAGDGDIVQAFGIGSASCGRGTSWRISGSVLTAVARVYHEYAVVADHTHYSMSACGGSRHVRDVLPSDGNAHPRIMVGFMMEG